MIPKFTAAPVRTHYLGGDTRLNFLDDANCPRVGGMGAGPIGLACAQWCRHFGARHVIAIDLMDREMIDPSPMLTGTVSLDEFPQIFEKLKTDKSLCKMVLVP